MRNTNWTHLFICNALHLLFACAYEPEDRPIKLFNTYPSEGLVIAADAPIRVGMDSYIEHTQTRIDRIELTTGDNQIGFDLSYDPVGRETVVRPRRNLWVGVAYTLKIKPGAMTDLSGTRTNGPLSIEFRAGPPTNEPIQPIDYERDIRPIFYRRCSCHVEQPAVAPQLLEWRRFINRASLRQPEYDVIRSGKPMESSLILRLLSDYPARLGETKTIPADEARLLVRWVMNLAPQ